MTKPSTPSVDAYVAAQPQASRRVLGKVRAAIRKALPDAEEVISYKIPAYRLHGRIVVYFAGWAQHYAIYPVGEAVIAEFERELAPYELSHKGTVRFPLDARVPVRLIAGIAKFRAREVAERKAAKGPAKEAAGRGQERGRSKKKAAGATKRRPTRGSKSAR